MRSTKTRGYREILVDRIHYRAHRLAWLYMTGEWPTNGVDHIDGDKLNNRFANLRDIPQAANSQNIKKATARSITGFLGVSPHETRFRARLRVNRKLINLGSYATAEEAYAVYLEAKRRLHPGNTL